MRSRSEVDGDTGRHHGRCEDRGDKRRALRLNSPAKRSSIPIAPITMPSSVAGMRPFSIGTFAADGTDGATSIGIFRPSIFLERCWYRSRTTYVPLPVNPGFNNGCVVNAADCWPNRPGRGNSRWRLGAEAKSLKMFPADGARSATAQRERGNEDRAGHGDINAHAPGAF